MMSESGSKQVANYGSMNHVTAEINGVDRESAHFSSDTISKSQLNSCSFWVQSVPEAFSAGFILA